MSVSIEALAMAGTDHVNWGMDFEEWERMDIEPPPPHLYAEQFDDYEEREREEDKEVAKVKTIPSLYELFGLLVSLLRVINLTKS
ncbi:hypothetical protein HanRHA438_Chr14g0658721 [Helianthus annuus]|nr:hypothetical protein HanRHA438_Chr14g0658721 [Helianthus annuus]